MTDWAQTTIGELCSAGAMLIQTGPFGSQLHAHDYVLVGIPVIPTEAIGRRRLKTEALPQISPETAHRLARHKLHVGDILFARRGAQATGLSAIVEKQHEGWLCGTGAILLRVLSPEINPVFLSFALTSDSSIDWLKSHAVGAVMPNLNADVIHSLPVQIPPLSEQRTMASILSAYDDKIELNRRMNETLEALARAIFKSWFVDFDPVRAKMEGRHPTGMDAETAVLFPAEFEDSALGQIPKGWKAGTLGEIAQNVRHGAQPEDVSPDTLYIGLEHMPRQSIALAEWGTVEEVTSNKSWFKQGDILFGKLRPYFHKVGVAAIDGVCSTDILVIAPALPEWYGPVLFHVSSTELVNQTNAASTGTKMPRASWQDIARYEIVIPTPEIADAFSQQASAIVQKIRSNIMESRTLATLRDTLLSKLLSGEVRVG